MSLRVVTDSTCDLSPEVLERHGIRVVPMYIHVGKIDYLDGVDLTRQQFYEQLPGYPEPPTTAAPGIDAFRTVYDQLAEEGARGIVSIHISQSLSNVFNVAQLAAQRTASVPVVAIDSGQLTAGVGLQAVGAAEAAERGASLDEMVLAARDLGRRTRTFAALSTVEYLRRSGRLTQFQAGLASMLRILPLLKMHQGVAEMEKVRTRDRAWHRLLQLLQDSAPLERLAVVHTNAPEEAARLLDLARPLLPQGMEPMFAQVTSVIGAHIGPGAVGFTTVTRST